MSGIQRLRGGRSIAAAVGLQVFATAAELAGPPAVHEVPFRFEHRQITIDVLVEGQGPFRMHLDTAVSPSAVDESVAEAVSLAAGQPAGFVAGFGSRRIPYRKATLGSISMAGFRLADLTTIVWDSSHLEIDGKPLLGILGESFFRRTWVQIDYPSRILRLVSNDERAPGFPADCSETGEALRVDLSGMAPRLLDVRVEGRPVTAVLDTGASGGLHLPLSEARRLGFGEKWENAVRTPAYGARGAFEARKTRADSVTLGGFELTDVETLISPSAGRVLIGNGLLQALVLTVDRHGGRVCLRRPGDGS